MMVFIYVGWMCGLFGRCHIRYEYEKKLEVDVIKMLKLRFNGFSDQSDENRRWLQ